MLDIVSYRRLKKEMPIEESHEKMVQLPKTLLRFEPHPYQSVGAPYNGYSPFFLRESVLQRVLYAQELLQREHKGYSLKIFDAFRPLSVQQYMIAYDRERIALERYGSSFVLLQKSYQEEIKNFVATFWSPLQEDVEKNPPPHSTGAAVDLTVCDADGSELDMGTKIDALMQESEASYYDGSATDYENNRKLLQRVMLGAGFTQLPTEWWHFSYGDQIWAVDNAREYAIYGVYERSNYP